MILLYTENRECSIVKANNYVRKIMYILYIDYRA